MDRLSQVHRSYLAAPSDRVWARVSTFAGINAELWPLARMTYPPHLARLDPVSFPLDVRAFRSVILLLGVLPVEADHLILVRMEPGRGFLERSSTLALRLWEHERTLEPAGPGCYLTDRLGFEPRWPPTAPLAMALVRHLFRHRHRRLRATFGGHIAPPT
jgi:hypothetical protein